MPGFSPRSYETCAFCPELCLDRCPVVKATGNNAYSPHSKMLVGYLRDSGVLDDVGEAAHLAYQCTACRSCTEACEHDVDVAWSLFALRASLVSRSLVPYERPTFEEDDGELKSILLGGLVPAKYVSEEAQSVLFPGCDAIRRGGRLLRMALRVLWGLGHEHVGISERVGRCCGYPLLAGGFVDAFEEQARIVGKELSRYRMVVVYDPRCYVTIRHYYPLLGIERTPRVVLLHSLLAKAVLNSVGGELPGGTHERVAVLDSCILARELGMVEEPRRVISRVTGEAPLELRLKGADSLCCGANGAFERVNPSGAEAAARNVLDLALETEAETLVSGCVGCTLHLRGSVNCGRPKVMDLVELVYRWLRGGRRRGGRE